MKHGHKATVWLMLCLWLCLPGGGFARESGADQPLSFTFPMGREHIDEYMNIRAIQMKYGENELYISVTYVILSDAQETHGQKQDGVIFRLSQTDDALACMDEPHDETTQQLIAQPGDIQPEGECYRYEGWWEMETPLPDVLYLFIYCPEMDTWSNGIELRPWEHQNFPAPLSPGNG